MTVLNTMNKSKDSKNLVVGLDIGTSKIVAIVADVRPDGSFEIIGMGRSQPANSVQTTPGWISPITICLRLGSFEPLSSFEIVFMLMFRAALLAR